MKFQYIGDPNADGEGPAKVEAFGLVFERNKGTEVTDEKVIAKLKANSHFEAIEEARGRRGQGE